ncbi:MAG: Gfo/Idh/MocA family oxidoreductase [Bacteroidetes bacterium]|nr:Gfo/Idh/MocA family oxidoreductase [Bacteroidota bacterium]
MQQVQRLTISRRIKIRLPHIIFLLLFIPACKNKNSQTEQKTDSTLVKLIILDPGHFHAALLQKTMNTGIDSTVHVFAPDGPELKSYLALIDKYNNRKDNPSSWKLKVYTGPDYFEKMLQTKPGNVVVIAGNNKRKADYIKQSVDDGLNVLADKPMAINQAGFDSLQQAFVDAKKNQVLLYDIMTERYEITNILQKAFSQEPDVFGELKKGTLENPAIVFESVHYFYKEVSGSPLVRPAWYFDVAQQGEGIVDVSTHMVDLVEWECFSNQLLDYKKDIQMITAKHWATVLNPAQFRQVTHNDAYPDFLRKNVKDSLLQVYANGEMDYTIKDIHARVSVEWKYQAPEGTGDTYYSMLQGTKANLIIRQGKVEQYKPVLYIEPMDKGNQNEWEQALQKSLSKIQVQYPGLSIKKTDKGWQLIIPERYQEGHEQHFAQVAKKYLGYLQRNRIPDWELSAMLAKYYTTIQALKKANNK